MNILKQQELLTKRGQTVTVTRTLDTKLAADALIFAAVGLVRNTNNQLLLVETPGRGWEFPGGHRHPQEAAIETLRREIMEEACVTLTNIQPIGHISFAYQGQPFDDLPFPQRYTQMFTAQLDQELPFIKGEADSRQWCNAQDIAAIRNLAFPDELLWLPYLTA